MDHGPEEVGRRPVGDELVTNIREDADRVGGRTSGCSRDIPVRQKRPLDGALDRGQEFFDDERLTHDSREACRAASSRCAGSSLGQVGAVTGEHQYR
jgi:hypothetical protein